MMPHIIVRRHNVSAKQCDSDLDQPRSVGLGTMGDGTDERARSFSHFVQYLGNAVLSHDGEILFATNLARRIQNAKGT